MTVSETDTLVRHDAAKRAMSIPEFCDLYGVGRTKVYEEMKAGRLHARKVGTRTIITKDAAESWLEKLPVFLVEGQANNG